MRIDCSKTLNYAKERERMCEFYSKIGECKQCPFYKIEYGCSMVTDIKQEHIDVLQKWSDEHPYETIAEHFFKMFPNARKTEKGFPVICLQDLGIQQACQTNGSCVDCWNMPYIESISNK